MIEFVAPRGAAQNALVPPRWLVLPDHSSAGCKEMNSNLSRHQPPGGVLYIDICA
jgi:hypothetical protein